jgi:hypothetical protein
MQSHALGVSRSPARKGNSTSLAFNHEIIDEGSTSYIRAC